jgi:hypothetical protein
MKYEERFNVQLNSHMSTAFDVSEVLLKQVYVISSELQGAQFLTRSWQAVALHCAKAKLPRQSESAQLHVTSSQSLSKDLHTLRNKFRRLSSKYRKEANMIDEVRHAKAPINDASN